MNGSRRFRRSLCAALMLTVLSVAPSTPPDAAAGTFEAVRSSELLSIRDKIRAAQFLSKATFGPTQAEIDALAVRIRQLSAGGQDGLTRACEEWIDRQFELPMTSHKQTALDILSVDGVSPTAADRGVSRYRYQVWWHIALTSEDQLRQRLAFALSQIVVIGDSGAGFNNNPKPGFSGSLDEDAHWLGMSTYYDMLCQNSFGNYRDVLGDVTFHPCMGVWLSHVRNRKANLNQGRFPDENYAREIMQLFSIGLFEMNEDGTYKTTDSGELIPTYDNETIKTLARLFTGFRYYHPTNTTSIFTGTVLTRPMQIRHQEHDNNRNYTDEPNAPQHKQIFGVTLDPLPSTLTEQACIDEINQGLDVIMDHPNVGPFISRLLIQRLVTSNPSRAYLARVTRVFNDNGSGVKGDLKAVVKAILLDPEVFRGQRVLRRTRPNRLIVIPRGTEYSRLREPIIRMTSMIRALKPRAITAVGTPASQIDYSQTNPPYLMLNASIGTDIDQMAYRSPTVFNFYLPDFQPPGDLIGYTPSGQNPYGVLYSPEFQILTAVTTNRTINRIRSIILNQAVEYQMYNANGFTSRSRIAFDLSEELELAKSMSTMPELIKRLDLLLCNGTLSDQSRQTILDAISDFASSDAGRNPEYRLEQALLAVLISPDCAIED